MSSPRRKKGGLKTSSRPHAGVSQDRWAAVREGEDNMPRCYTCEPKEGADPWELLNRPHDHGCSLWCAVCSGNKHRQHREGCEKRKRAPKTNYRDEDKDFLRKQAAKDTKQQKLTIFSVSKNGPKANSQESSAATQESSAVCAPIGAPFNAAPQNTPVTPVTNAAPLVVDPSFMAHFAATMAQMIAQNGQSPALAMHRMNAAPTFVAMATNHGAGGSATVNMPPLQGEAATETPVSRGELIWFVCTCVCAREIYFIAHWILQCIV